MARVRYLVLSDIHGNLEALQSVFRAVERRRYAGVLCLGDLVGYGASPNAVVTRIRRLKNLLAVRGNHDKVASGLENGDNFNASALEAARWTRQRLTPPNLAFLQSLPRGPREVLPGILLAHGSVLDEDGYLFSDFDAYQCFRAFPFRIAFFGHTHFPVLYQQSPKGVDFLPLSGDTVEVVLDPSARYLVNPGSVGQPRDRNPKASFAEFYPETGRLILRRVAYDVEGAAGRIRKAGLPLHLANRLALGA